MISIVLEIVGWTMFLILLGLIVSFIVPNWEDSKSIDHYRNYAKSVDYNLVNTLLYFDQKRDKFKD